MKKLFCYLFGHSLKKEPFNGIFHAKCSVCGGHFIYDPELEHHFSEEELSTEISEEKIYKDPGFLQE
jgi:hypothetical protein